MKLAVATLTLAGAVFSALHTPQTPQTWHQCDQPATNMPCIIDYRTQPTAGAGDEQAKAAGLAVLVSAPGQPVDAVYPCPSRMGAAGCYTIKNGSYYVHKR